MTTISLPTPRIERLREHALRVLESGTSRSPEPELLAARAWMAHAGEPWTVVRRAHETAAILRGMTPLIDEGELQRRHSRPGHQVAIGLDEALVVLPCVHGSTSETAGGAA